MDKDKIVSPHMIGAVGKQAGMQEQLEQEQFTQLLAHPAILVDGYQKLLRIIAYAYQIAGVHDCPEHILDVLSDPEGATEEQIEAMLPYRAPSRTDEQIHEIMSRHVDCDFKQGLAFARELLGDK
jgi:hypothetical protein